MAPEPPRSPRPAARRPGVRAAIALAAWLAAPALGVAQDVGGSVVVRDPARENLYVAGGEVDVRAEVDGDVAAAGGRVLLDGVVTRDALVAGGDVTVRGRVGDDLRVAGGLVTLGGPIAGELLAAGGRVRVAPEAAVSGRAWLAGGIVEVQGRVGKTLRAAGGTIRLGGQVDGDVDVAGREIEIGPAARIGGSLTYRSPHPARIDPAARIAGAVTHRRTELPAQAVGIARTASIALSVLGLLALGVTGVALLLLFPGFLTTSARTIARDPWTSLGLGLLVLVATPPVGLVLLVSVLGIPLALMLLAVYAVALVAGGLVAALFLGDVGARWLGRGDPPSRGTQIVALLGALVVLALVRWIPIAGTLVLFLAVLFGVGALTLQSARAYTRRPAAGHPA